jgi:hypothetical protein
MSLDVMRKLIEANPGVPDGSLQRVRACDVVAACDEVSEAKRDKKLAAIRYGSANCVSDQTNEDRKESCIVIIPIGYMRHLIALAGG